MKRFIEFYDKRKNKFIFITTMVLIVLFIMPFITTRNMNIKEAYTKKEDVALYIIQHHELPTNYITKYGYDYVENHGLSVSGYIIGGDTHFNTEQLKEFGVGKSANLKECDIAGQYYDINNHRGGERLVYTCNTGKVRVFYTYNHYKSFEEVSLFHLQLTRNVFWIIFGVYSILFVAFYIIVHYIKKADAQKSLPNP